MDAYWPPLLAAALVFAAFSGAAALWNRSRVTQLRRRLEDAENSRFAAEETARALVRQLDTPAPAGDQAERRAALDRALAPAERRGADWPETQPMTMTPEMRPFAPTQAMEEPPPR
ncbi:hypothetical protein [Rubrivivax gelatinosus]|uniref:Uncharacterized protein n=1 Tax=Rubrivivax gelatinosus TaxID=28068 RepID=A0ABS1DUH7_RUBGE|nr:hypothetical protein [Rubrivivax gelatinosus]MBK1713697.1 hypothetical protein [Rubrivivax gelatinosus]